MVDQPHITPAQCFEQALSLVRMHPHSTPACDAARVLNMVALEVERLRATCGQEAKHLARIDDLLEANNRYLQEARDARAVVRAVREFVETIDRHPHFANPVLRERLIAILEGRDG